MFKTVLTYPKLSATIVAAPYIYEVYRWITEKSESEIEKTGYEKAKNQLQEDIRRNSIRAFEYTTKDIDRIKNGYHVLENYRKDALNFLIRPYFPIRLLGDDYIISSHKTTFGWLLRKQDFEQLLENWKFLAFNGNIDKNCNIFLEEVKSKTKEEMNEQIQEKTSKAWDFLQDILKN